MHDCTKEDSHVLMRQRDEHFGALTGRALMKREKNNRDMALGILQVRGRVPGSLLSRLFITVKNVCMVAHTEICCTAEDSDMMCMVARRKIHMSRCDSKMCMLARGRMLY